MEIPVAALSGHDRGHSTILQPVEQPAQFDPQPLAVLQRAEQDFDRVEDYPRCSYGGDRHLQANEQRLKVPITRSG